MYSEPSHAGLASLVASRGRGGDSTLVHMSPEEVRNLQNIAEANGVTLTLNPHTGLPEAGLLGDVFSAIWGGIKTVGQAALKNPELTSTIIGSTYGALKGDLSKGLQMGMKAYAGTSLLSGITSGYKAASGMEPAKSASGKREPWADYEDMYAPSPKETSKPIQPIKPTVQPNIFQQLGTGIAGILNPRMAQQQPQQGGVPTQGTQGGQQVDPITRLILSYGLNKLESKYGGSGQGRAPAQPIKYQNIAFSRGRVNPRFPEPGQPYWIEGGYTDYGTTDKFPGYTSTGNEQTQAPNQPPEQPQNPGIYGMAGGGIIPAPNPSYPMGHIQHSAYAVSSQDPQQAEMISSGYDTAVNPFTGEESKSQTNFADGGSVNEDDRLKDYFNNLRPNAPELANAYGGAALNAGLGALQGTAPKTDSLQPVAPELADYYRSLLVPPGKPRDRIDLSDYFKISGFRASPNMGKVCPSGQHLDTTTMQCVDDTVSPPPPPPPVECPSGQVRGASGQCEPIPPPDDKTCKEGQVLNKATGKCEDTAKGCGPGTHVEIVDGVMGCVPDNEQCEPGYHNDASGKCVPDEKKPVTCDKGYHADSSGKCVPDEKSTCIEVEDPGTGNVITGSDCACPEGMEKDPNDDTLCVKSQNKTPTVCDKGYHADASGKCVPDEKPPVTCDKGYHADASGKCVPDEKDNKCGVEVEDPDTGNIIIGGPDCACPEGTTRDPKNPSTCIKNKKEEDKKTTCDEGYHSDGYGGCIKNTPTDEECSSMTPNSVYSKVTGQCECAEGYTRTESGDCKKFEADIETCPEGTKMVIGDTGEPRCELDETAKKDPIWQTVLEKFGGYFLPVKAQLAIKAYKSAKVLYEGCGEGKEAKFDYSKMEFTCAPKEDKEPLEKDPRAYLYPSGGGGYSFGCPDPSMMIHLADGGEVAAGELKVGDMVRTMHEKTLEWGDYEITYKEIVNQPKIEISLDSGKKKVIVSESHRFWVNEKHWVYAVDLNKGDSLSGHIVSDMKALGEGPVVKITVNDAHTYIMEGLFSHNIKSLGPSGAGGRGYDVDVEQLVDENGNPIISNAAGGRIKSKRKYATGGIAGLNSGAINLADGYNFGFAQGGMAAMPEYKAGGKLLRGPGDGMSDDIPAVIKGKQPQRAALADGEFVVPADVVSHLGNGSTEAGAKKLYKMMAQIRQARTGKAKQAPRVNTDKFLPSV